MPIISYNVFSGRWNFKIFVLIFCFYSSHKALAGFGTSLMQTATVLTQGNYEARLQNDFVFRGDGGYNVSAHLQTGVFDPFLDLNFFLGTGTTNFQGGASGKINLLPDLPEQVGLAINFGASYLHDKVDGGGINFLLLSFGVLLSKEFLTQFGSMTPYSAFQFEGVVQSGNDNSRVPLTLVLGSKIKLKDFNYPLYSELGINLHEANTYIALGIAYTF
jgi:hypothetical protein